MTFGIVRVAGWLLGWLLGFWVVFMAFMMIDRPFEVAARRLLGCLGGS